MRPSKSVIRLLGWIAFAACCAGSEGRAVADAPAVVQTLGSKFELTNDETRVPLILKVGASRLRFEVRDVYQNDRHDKRFVESFAVRFDPGNAKVGPALFIKPDPKLIAGPGDYLMNVIALVSPEKPPDGGAADPQVIELILTLTRPTATIEAVSSKISVERERPFRGDDGKLKMAFQVREKGGRVDATPVRLALLFPSNIPPAQPSFVPDGGVPAVARDGVTTLTYELEDEFPLGTTTGTVELSAPQLDKAVSIPIEVKTRRPHSWILFFAFLGIFIGFSARTASAEIIRRSQAQLEVRELLAEIASLSGRHRDKNLRKTLAEQKQLLDDALAKVSGWRKIDQSVLTQTTTSVRTAITEALKTLANDRKQMGDSLTKIAVLAGKAWSLPASMQSVLARVRDTQERASTALGQDDLDGAATDREQARAALKTLPALAADWSNSLAAGLALLSQDNAIGAALVKPQQTAIGAIKPDGMIEGESDVEPVLTEIHNQRSRLTAAMSRWLDEIDKRLDAMADVAEVQAQLATLRDGSARARESLRRGEVESVVEKAAPELLRDLGPVVEAAEKIRAQKKATDEKRGGDEERTLEAYAVSGEDTTSATGEAPAPVEVAAPSVVERVLAALSIELPAQRDAVRSFWALVGAQALQSLFVCGLLVFSAYLLYADKFVGTPRELGMIFFWAFSLDLGVDSAKQIGQGFAKPPSA